MTEPLKIALAGLGTVGAGVIKLLDANRALITRRAGRELRFRRGTGAGTAALICRGLTGWMIPPNWRATRAPM